MATKTKTRRKATKAAEDTLVGCLVPPKKKKAPKKNNFQKWLAYMKKYPPGATPSVDGNTIIVTARRRSGGLVPDRSFKELSDWYSKDVFPLLRVIDGTITFYPLNTFDGSMFVFEAALRIEEDPGSNKKTLITPRYTYSETAFLEDTKTFENTPVDITYEPLEG